MTPPEDAFARIDDNTITILKAGDYIISRNAEGQLIAIPANAADEAEPSRWAAFTNDELSAILAGLNSTNGDTYNDFALTREVSAELERRQP